MLDPLPPDRTGPSPPTIAPGIVSCHGWAAVRRVGCVEPSDCAWAKCSTGSRTGGCEDAGVDERTFDGGSENHGAVVRAGNTVRRPRGAGCEVVEALLTHLEQVEFKGSPRFLGIDQQGLAGAVAHANRLSPACASSMPRDFGGCVCTLDGGADVFRV